MPFWPWQRPSPKPTYPMQINARPTDKLEERALDAFFIKKDWPLAERLFREVIDKADPEGRRIARIHLGKVLEKMKRVDEAIAFYEANIRDSLEIPFSAERLAIIYHKQHRPEDELRIARIAIAYHKRHHSDTSWWDKRLARLQP